jgi:hypothetical protein
MRTNASLQDLEARSYGLIAEMTDAAHDEVNMLDFASANRLGIKMTVLSTQRKAAAAPKPQAEWCPTCAPVARNLPR